MRVLYVAHVSDLYGANKSLLDLILLLKEKYGVEPIVLLPQKGQMVCKLHENGIQHIIWKYWGWQRVKTNEPFKLLIKLWNNLSSYALSIVMKVKRIDAVHSNSSVTDMGIRIAQKINCRHIWHLREFGKEDYELEYIYKISKVREMYEKSDILIAISDAVKMKYEKLAPQANITRIYNGVKYMPQYKQRKPGSQPVKFCCVGKIAPKKRQSDIIEACRILNHSEYKDYIVYIVGEGNHELTENIKEKISAYQLENNIKLCGRREDVSEILKEMDVGIMPSESEAFGRVTVEYMLSSMPVIGAHSAGTAEIIVDGVNGKLYSVGCYAELAEKMKEFLMDRRSIEHLGNTACNEAIRQFSMERNAYNINVIYKNI